MHFRYGSEGLGRSDLAAERDARADADEQGSPSSLLPGPADGHTARVGRRRRQQRGDQDRRQHAQQQAQQARDPRRHRQVAALVQADDHRLQSPGLAAQEARELGRQRHQEPGVDQVAAGLGYQ